MPRGKPRPAPPTFVLDVAQAAKFAAWLKEHDKVCSYARRPRRIGPIGGRFEYRFRPTNVGVAATVHCNCKAYVDLTDYEAW